MTDISLLDPKVPILIVEDSPDYALVLQKMLSVGLGYTAVTVKSNLADALSEIEGDPEKFKLLFIDYNLPNGSSGWDLVNLLGSKGLMEGKTAFFITAHPDIDKAKQAASAGLAGVVLKPFDRSQLQNVLKRADRDLEMARISEEG